MSTTTSGTSCTTDNLQSERKPKAEKTSPNAVSLSTSGEHSGQGSSSTSESSLIDNTPDLEYEKLLLYERQHVEDAAKQQCRWNQIVRQLVASSIESPVLLASTASLSISLNQFVVKILSQKYSVFQITLFRAVLVIGIVLFILLWKGIYLIGPRQKIPLLIVRGSLGSFAFICNWVAVTLLPLSEASFLLNSYPVVTAILSSLTGMEHLNWLCWLGIAGTAIGNALVAHPPLISGGHQDWGTGRIVGLAVSTSSVLAVGSTFIIIKRIGKNVHPFVHIIYQLGFSLIFSVPFLFASYPKEFKVPEGLGDAMLFLVASLGAFSTQGLTVIALQKGSPTKVTTVLMMNMIYSTLLGILALHESLSLISGTGALVVLVSVLLVIIQRSSSKQDTYITLPHTEKTNEIELEHIVNNNESSRESIE
eukprot:g8132.t1